MKFTIRSQTDFAAGVILAAIGLTALFVARGYPTGTLSRVGPGLFPSAAALLLIGLALVLIVGSLAGRTQTRLSIEPMPVILIIGAGVLFAVMLRPLGLVPAAMTVVLLVSLGTRSLGWLAALVLAAFVATFLSLVFIGGLGLQARPFGDWLV